MRTCTFTFELKMAEGKAEAAVVDEVSMTALPLSGAGDEKERQLTYQYYQTPRKRHKPERRSLTRGSGGHSGCSQGLYVHEVYHHASDPERKNTMLPSSQLNVTCLSSPLSVPSNRDPAPLMLPCDDVPLNKDDLSPSPPHSSTSISGCLDQEQIVTAVYEHSVAETNAITNSYLTNLTFLRENIEYNLYSQASYLQLVESLAATGASLPLRHSLSVLSDVLKSNNSYFIIRMKNSLRQNPGDLLSLPKERTLLWDTMNRSLEILKTVVSQDHDMDLTQTTSFQASKAVLEYSFRIFRDDLMHQLPHDGSNGVLHSSLLDRVLSFTSKWSWCNKMLSAAFSLVNFDVLAKRDILECLDILLGLALLPLLTLNSKSEQEEFSTTLAKQLSQRIGRLANSFKKHFVISRIPSEHVRLKVIDIHLDEHFDGGTSPSSTEFTLSKFKLHLQKTIVKSDGTRHDLEFFLSLLTTLLQSHLLIVSGVPLLTFLPDQHGLAGEATFSLSHLQSQLRDLNQQVTAFINRLSTDPVTASSLVTPTNWNHLELLILLTS